MKSIFMLFLLLFAACGAPNRTASTSDRIVASQPSTDGQVLPFRLQLPLPPADLDPEGRRLFLREHFWDNFPFSDSTVLDRIDSTELVQAYIAYVGQVLTSSDTASMRRLMRQADSSKPMLRWFHEMGEQLLYDPNSPIRSDELYIPVLEQVVASSHYDAYEKLAPAYDLELVRRNRVGHKATDFSYTLADGTTRRLYGIRAPWTLLFISNPGCPMCGSIRQALQESPLMSELIERGELCVLMLYPDEDLTEWRVHRAEIPSSWIYAYDRGMVLQRDRLYDLKAIPSLYLLDANKRVILKDVVDVAWIEYTLHERR